MLDPEEELPDTKPLRQPDIGALITTAVQQVFTTKSPDQLVNEVIGLIESHLERISLEDLQLLRINLMRLLSLPSILHDPTPLFVKNRDKHPFPSCYVHLVDLNFLDLYNLFAQINTWSRMQKVFRPSDKYLNCYMAVLDELPVEEDPHVIEILSHVRFSFPTNPQRVYFTLLVEKEQFFDGNGNVSKRGEIFLRMLDRSRLGEIMNVTIDKEEFTRIAIESIKEVAEATSQ